MVSGTLTDRDVCEGAYRDILVAVPDTIGGALERWPIKVEPINARLQKTLCKTSTGQPRSSAVFSQRQPNFR